MADDQAHDIAGGGRPPTRTPVPPGQGGNPGTFGRISTGPPAPEPTPLPISPYSKSLHSQHFKNEAVQASSEAHATAAIAKLFAGQKSQSISTPLDPGAPQSLPADYVPKPGTIGEKLSGLTQRKQDYTPLRIPPALARQNPQLEIDRNSSAEIKRSLQNQESKPARKGTLLTGLLGLSDSYQGGGKKTLLGG